jgi:hypothetical protein
MSFFSFLQGNSVICPFCLTENRFSSKIDNCLKCKLELPVQYVNNYNHALPFFVQLVGWTRVGKTVYLQSLTLMLKRMERFWGNDYVISPLTESTREFMKNVKTYEVDGAMPIPTQVKLHDAYVMLLQGMERWGGRTLVTRDVAGENFFNLQFPLEYMPYLVHVPTTLMMISLPDLYKEKKLSVDDLMNSFVDTLARNRRNYRSENLKVIIVLSKADKFKNDLPIDLREYLESDPFNIRSNNNKFVDWNFMNDYMNKLYKTSGKLKDWFTSQPGGQMLVNKAAREGLSLEFTLVSSTGADPGQDAKMLVDINPLRVLDPYFLALDFYSKSV